MSTPSLRRPGPAWLVLLAASALVLMSCARQPDPDPQPEVRSLTIDQEDQTLNVGQELQLTLTIDAIGGADTSVDWTSSATDVTTVDNHGLIVALSPGSATVSATSVFDASQSDSVTITVSDDPDDPDAPTVTNNTPADGATDVPTGVNITVTFSEPMDPTATEGAFASDPSVACTFAWDTTDTTLTCTPDAPLEYDTSYTVTITTDASDRDENALEQAHSFTFTTVAQGVDELCVFGTSLFGDCHFGP